MYRIHELKLNIGEDKSLLPGKIEKLIGAPVDSWKIVRESIDARDKGDIKLVYTVDFGAEIPEDRLRMLTGAVADKNGKSGRGLGSGKIKIETAPEVSYEYPAAGTAEDAAKMSQRPVIVGFGPCGMFAALVLSQMGYRPVVLERGKRVEERVKDVQAFWEKGVLCEESNVQFGEGGAGTFSDGKLTTQIKDRRVRKVLEEFAAAGGGEELLYKQKPHIGTDVLRVIVRNIREKIIENGGEIRFESKMTGIVTQDGRLTAVEVNGGESAGGYSLEAQVLITAIGHSARDTFRMLYSKGLPMQQKPFSIGVRIRHPQRLINQAQYGRQDIGAADYKLSYHCKNGRGVYTFCMCPGGEIIKAASQKGMTVTNGMSYSARSGEFANSGLLVDVRTADFPSDSPLAGVDFQEKYERLAFKNGGENYELPTTTWKDFKKARIGESSEDPVAASLPEFAVESIKEAMPYLGRKLKGFDSPDAVMKGVETRSSSPVRLLRDKNFESDIKGIFPGGEGAGYAGGIVSAACDGIRIAEEIIRRYFPK